MWKRSHFNNAHTPDGSHPRGGDPSGVLLWSGAFPKTDDKSNLMNSIEPKPNRKYFSTDLLLLALIFIVGFALRNYRVGEDSLWFDEVGQVEAALQPDIAGTLNAVASHAGAMPLDYLVTRLVVMFSLREEMLRLPAVIWGTLSIIVYFVLINHLDIPHKKQTALLLAFLISISPANIQYSQEVRFYSSLMFFYGLTTLCLVRALAKHEKKEWLTYALCNIVGMYFHPYVIFIPILGFFWIARQYMFERESSIKAEGIKKNVIFYTASCILILIAFLPGYFYFHTQDSYIFKFELIPDNILYGLGLKAIIFGESLPPFGLLHLILSIGVIGGGLLALRHSSKYAPILLLCVSAVVQIIVILFLDYLNNYLFIPRQIVHLTPFTYLLFSAGVIKLISIPKAEILRYALSVLVICGLLLSSLPYVKIMYNHSKGGTRDIAQAIADRYQPGQKVASLYPQNTLVLRYYLSLLAGRDESHLMIVPFDEVNDMADYVQVHPEVRFVYLSQSMDADIRKKVVDLGFKQLRVLEDSDFVYIRE